MSLVTEAANQRTKPAGYVTITLESGTELVLAVSKEHALAALDGPKTFKVKGVGYAPAKPKVELNASDFA